MPGRGCSSSTSPSGTRGIVVGGTTGESATLKTELELRQLVIRARDQLQGPPAAAGWCRHQQHGYATVDRAGWIGALGVDALLVVTPAYNKPTQEGLYLHYKAVAAASPVPVMLYNVPGRTAVDLLPQTVARLAQLPQIVALKEAVADIGRIRELVAACGPGFDVLSGRRCHRPRGSPGGRAGRGLGDGERCAAADVRDD